MNLNEFDCLIKKQLNQPESLFGYKVGDRVYKNYYTLEEFEKYKSSLKNIKLDGKSKTVFEAYIDGKGGELIEKYIKKSSKVVPPKMASVASSSRFTIESILKAPSENIHDVFDLNINYKKDAEIGFPFQRGGRAPQLDAYLYDEIKEIYIEAKCHEIFGSHRLKMSKSYTLHFEKMVPNYSAPNLSDNEDLDLDVSLLGYDSSELLRFDAKQALAHILGVKKNRKLDTKLVFLFFKPCDDPIFEIIKNQTFSFINSKFVQAIINNEFEVEFAFLKSESMVPLDINNYKPFIKFKNNKVEKLF